MPDLTGLFRRGPSYYLRVVLPHEHPDRTRYRSGKVVLSLGACSPREAVANGILLRAKILGRTLTLSSPAMILRDTSPTHQPPPVLLREVFEKWVEAKTRTEDTVKACSRALALFELQTGNPPLASLNRASGVSFRAWLQHPDRNTTSKTARDRLTWVKSLLKFAQVDLEVIPRSPWEGLDIQPATTLKRRSWTGSELKLLFGQALYTSYALPSDKKAGADAAYWIPLLGLYSGARISELVQLRRCDFEQAGDVHLMKITNEGDDQSVKTAASVRKVPLHSELVRLGFVEYLQRTCSRPDAPLWPLVPRREGKSRGFFSQWFGTYRRSLGLGTYPDFHCFRHTVRSALANAEVAEPLIDMLLGHEVKGSMGARVYTHRTIAQARASVEKITYPDLLLPRVLPSVPGLSAETAQRP